MTGSVREDEARLPCVCFTEPERVMRRAASLPSSARREEKNREEKRRDFYSSALLQRTQLQAQAHYHGCSSTQFICGTLPPTLWLSLESAETAMIAHFLRAYGWTMWWDSSLHLREPDQRHPMEKSCYSSCWAAQWKMKRPSSERFSEREKKNSSSIWTGFLNIWNSLPFRFKIYIAFTYRGERNGFIQWLSRALKGWYNALFCPTDIFI